jgi:hypothetical protein
MAKRCVIVPSIAVSMFTTTEVTLRVRRVTLEDVAKMAKDCDIVLNFIRHQPTNKILSEVVNFAMGGTEYKLSADDIIFVVGLKYRAPISGQDINVTPDDLLILAVEVLSLKT